MTDEKKNTPRMQSNSTSFPEPEQIREQAERKAQSIQQPDFSSMTLGEIQQQFHELQVKQIEAELQNEQLCSGSREAGYQAEILTTITENMLDMIGLTDIEGNFIFAGKVHEVLGYETSFLIGKNAMDLVHPEDLSHLLQEFSQLLASGVSNPVEYRYREKDGSYLWFETVGKVVNDENGTPHQIVFNARDITERKRAEDALQESEEKYRLLIDNLNEGVWQIDKEGYTFFVNDSMAEMLGYTVQEMQGKHLFDFMDAQEAQLTKNYMQRRQKGIKEQHEHILVCKDGSCIFTSLETSPVYDKDGKYIGAIAGVQDVTARKQAEEALRQSENYYRSIFETSGSAMFIIEEDTTISDVNSNFEELTGYSRQEVEGKKSWTEFIPPDDVGWMKENHYLRRRDPQAAPIDYEFRFFVRNGELRHGYLTVDIIPSTSQSVASFIDITERKQAEQQLRESEEKYRDLFQSSIDGIAKSDLEGKIVDCNKAYLEMTGHSEEEIKSLTYRDLTPERWANVDREHLDQCLNRGYSDPYEKERIRKDGTVFPISIMTWLRSDSEGNPLGFWGIVHDITERKQAEKEQERLQAQLTQAQKMESVGRLAGGVAHDFNNKLSIINGYAELTLDMLEPEGPDYENLNEIYNAGKRSANIVRQLLAFARQQTVSPIRLDLNDTISSMLKMLQRLIGENIDIEWHPGIDLALVKMDPSQVDQIMANLAVNARDAISDVGKLTIETKNTVVDADFCKSNPEAIPGRYVMLAVSDDGCGIEKEVREQVFDPYFTTKEIGKGTGLGLPTIYGIVKQNNGFINVYSEPVEGTTFKLYFPSHEETKPSLHSAKESTGEIPTGTETVLVVEDEKTILQMSKQMLERLGYTVETAGSPAEALQIFKEHDGTIHLLITDVIMPEMNGRDFSSQLIQTHPGVKTLYMSGYTADVIAHHGVLDEGLQFIQKPFSLKDLAVKVREVLEQE